MKMAMANGIIRIREADKSQFSVIKSWNKMKWNRSQQELSGMADMELLDKLSTLVKLPSYIETHRQRLHAVADAVDRERMNENPTPMLHYPVKLPLFRHQTRGANMAAIIFGFVQPGGEQGEH